MIFCDWCDKPFDTPIAKGFDCCDCVYCDDGTRLKTIEVECLIKFKGLQKSGIVGKWEFKPLFYIARPYPIPSEEEESLWPLKKLISTPTFYPNSHFF